MGRDLSLAPCGLVIESVEAEAWRACHFGTPNVGDCRLSDLRFASRRKSTAPISDRWPTCPHMAGRSGSNSRTRRFRCVLATCGRRIFTERLAATAGRPFARRTTRLEGIVHHLGLALGGRPGQSFARRLLLPVSKDTLLRVVRRHSRAPSQAPRVVGIDDWAFKRGHRYGTIICDLEQRRIIDLLPDREAATVTAWLAARPSIDVIARDRGAGYIQAATDGRPNAIQVADRWHLMENASAAFLTAVQHSMQGARAAVGSDVVDPAALSCAEGNDIAGILRLVQHIGAALVEVLAALAAEPAVALGCPAAQIARGWRLIHMPSSAYRFTPTGRRKLAMAANWHNY